MNGIRSTCRIRVVLAELVIGSLLIVGCSQGATAPTSGATSGPATAPGNTATLGPVAPLTIAIGTAFAGYAVALEAQSKGLFDKNGVSVNIASYNALTTGTPQLVAGQIDLLLISPSEGVLMAQSGKATSAIFDLWDFNARLAAVLAKPGISSLSQLASLGTNCKLGLTAPGTGFRAYMKAVASTNGIKCQAVELGTPAANLTAVLAGSIDAGPVQIQDALTAEAAGKGNILVNPSKLSDADAKKIVPQPYASLVVFGLKANLASKRESVTRFLRALVQAAAILPTETSDQIAAGWLQLPTAPFGTATQVSLAQAIDVFKPTFPTGPNAGDILQSGWATALSAFVNDWDSPNLDVNGAAAKYENAVDMSFLTAARK